MEAMQAQISISLAVRRRYCYVLFSRRLSNPTRMPWRHPVAPIMSTMTVVESQKTKQSAR